jgi:hypothetical protein
VKINSAPNTPLQALLSANRPDFTRLRPNDLIEVVMAGVKKDGSTLLRFGNMTLVAKLDPPPDPGTRLILEVIRLGPKPLFRLNTSTPQTQAIVQALRAALPQQGSLSPLLNTLGKLPSLDKEIRLPASVTKTIQQFFNSITQADKLTDAKNLKSAIQNSGYFLESKLSRSQQSTSPLLTSIQADIKSHLLRLKAQLQNASTSSPDTAQRTAQNTATKLQPAIPPKAQSYPSTAETPAKQNIPVSDKKNPVLLNSGHNALQTSVAKTHSGSSEAKLDWLVRLALARAPIASTAIKEALPPLSGTDKAAMKDAGILLPELKPLLSTVFPQAQSSVSANTKLFTDSEGLIRWLIRQVDSSLSRIQVGQLNQAVAEQDNKNYWMFEIPIRKGDEVTLFHMRIDPEEKESGPDSGKEKTWTVRLAFELQALGEVHIKLQVTRQSISTQFWLENETVLNLFEKHIHQLQEALESRGLTVQQLLGFLGRPYEDSDPDMLSGYLDENA